MRYTIDTEFLEDGERIRLISIGLVAEDGRTFYRVVRDYELLKDVYQHKWLRKNVFPSLPVTIGLDDEPYWDELHPDYHKRVVVEKPQIAEDLKVFFDSDTNISLWGWYSAYDHVAYAQLFGRMIDLPLGFPMWTNDIKQEHARLGFPRIPEQLEGSHNALNDAKWNWTVLRYLEALDGPVTPLVERPESTLNGGWRTRTANPKRTRLW